MSKLTECKQTELGKIPKDWNIAYLGDSKLANLIMGQSPPSSTYNKKANGLPFLQGNAEFGDKYPKPTIYCSEPIKIAEQSDILISVRAPVGDINMVKSKVCIGRGLAAIRPNQKILSKVFLYYHLQHNKRKFEMLSAGSTFKAIRRHEFDLYEIPLPSLPEQRKIAEILSTVDEAIEKVDQAIEKTERLKKGLMQELLTKGIGHKEFKDTEIGRIPKEWNVLSLEEIINLKSGQYFKFSEFRQNGIRCLKIDNIGFKEILWDTITYLPEDYVDKYGELVLNAEDIVIALNRPIIKNKLKIAQLKENDVPAILYQRVGKIIIKDNSYINSTYLFLVLSGDYFKNKLIRFLIGTDQPYIRTPVFLSIKIPIPGEVEEQQKISGILKIVYNRLKLQKTKKWKLKIIKKGLMNDLLTGKKRVII